MTTHAASRSPGDNPEKIDPVRGIPPDTAARSLEHSFLTEMIQVQGQTVRVGRQPGQAGGVPLLMFNGIGGNIELLSPLTERMPQREIITFDIPGVGHSPMPTLPYRLPGIARIAAGILDHFGHEKADVMGVSWGGAAAQQFARSQSGRCRRLILCATSMGMAMIPSHPAVALKMATPRRYMNKAYAATISGDIYGGDFRTKPELAAGHFRHVKWQSRMGYYLQLFGAVGWTSVHWLHSVKQPTLVMAGDDDPLIPLANARLMHMLIPNSELQIYDCGHLFLLTRAEASSRAINEFLDRP